MATPQSSITLSMKKFPEEEMSSVENFFSIDQNTLVLNQDIVESASIIGLDAKQASVLLNLKDGTSVQKQFDIAAGGISEHKVAVNKTRH